MDNYENPKPGKTYISPSLPAFGQKDRKVRIASKVIESPCAYDFATVKGETVIRQKEDARTGITAKFFEDNRGIFVLSIQKFTAATGNPYGAGFSFVGDEISTLLEFITNIQSVDFKGSGAVNISDEELRRMVLSKPQAQHIFADNEELF
jgi:hypothetical protein